MNEIQKILASNDPVEVKALFTFDSTDSDAAVVFKFNLWARKHFPQYFTSGDADFHKQIDGNLLKAYRGLISVFVDIAFRGAGKTARTKLFVAFVIANDRDHRCRYFKVLSEDLTNSKQIVTDIYNMLIASGITRLYPEIFAKTRTKREETMETFTTSTGVKVIAGTVGTDQRGSLQEDVRPDFILFEDFETRTTLRSARKTRAIWENMEEARTGLARGGACIYNCNYISEQGNVHALVQKTGDSRITLIVPILDRMNESVWDRYTKAEIEQMRHDDDDFEGERMCKPSASKDVFFDRESLDKQVAIQPLRESAGLKMFRRFDPSHRIASGHDVAGGVGLDSSTSVFIDFDVVPAQVAATFKSNTIRPDTFGDEVSRQSLIYGGAMAAIEKNNHGHATIARARQLEVEMYTTRPKEDVKVGMATPKEYGWHTNALTKPKMLFAFAKAVEDGLLVLNDESLIAECMSYTRNDLIDDEDDPRLTTRHFDLLTAACIAWQMKDHATVPSQAEESFKRRSGELGDDEPTDGVNPFHYNE